jgi:pyruvate kinase
MREIEIMATLWPEMPHYKYFAADPRLKGIRLNTAKAEVSTIRDLTRQAVDQSYGTPIYFDVKGRQLRIAKVDPREDHLEIELNHEVTIETPCIVLFKGGTDHALLVKAEGKRLIFEGGPHYMVTPGDSLNVRAPYEVHGDLFPEKQLYFLDVALKAGIKKFMLSFARNTEEIEELREIVGEDCEIIAKIEDQKGLDFIDEAFDWKTGNGGAKWGTLYSKKGRTLSLLNARGDLFVELDKPHEIIKAAKEIIRLDPRAILGSRILLSVTEEEVPSCADLHEVAYLLGIGYRRFMFCDGLCLNKDALNRSVNILATVAKDLGYTV